MMCWADASPRPPHRPRRPQPADVGAQDSGCFEDGIHPWHHRTEPTGCAISSDWDRAISSIGTTDFLDWDHRPSRLSGGSALYETPTSRRKGEGYETPISGFRLGLHARECEFAR